MYLCLLLPSLLFHSLHPLFGFPPLFDDPSKPGLTLLNSLLELKGRTINDRKTHQCKSSFFFNLVFRYLVAGEGWSCAFTADVDGVAFSSVGLWDDGETQDWFKHFQYIGSG